MPIDVWMATASAIADMENRRGTGAIAADETDRFVRRGVSPRSPEPVRVTPARLG
jgi:hypothetical protein